MLAWVDADVITAIDLCAANPCSAPRTCSMPLPGYFQCSPCPLGYNIVNDTACSCA